MAGVRFDGVTKRFGDVTAVDDLDLEVEDGEFLVLLGPSGCGKTTALRMIAGLEEITEGKLWIGDRVVNDVEPRDRDLAMVFQSYALYPHLSVRKNIESPLVVRPYRADGDDRPPRRLTAAEREERIAEAARMLGLEPYLARKPRQLSGGQRQRVALARAVVARPGVLLMDEPLSNLDAKLRGQTRAELVDLHRRFPATVVYVTHDQVEAMTMASRIAVMAAGRLLQVGTPREVYERPADLFVASFIGTPPMNTVRGRVVDQDGSLAVDAAGSRFPVPGGADVGAGAEVVVGIRPEHLHVDPAGPVRATVRHVEWLGHEALVTAELDTGDPSGDATRDASGAASGDGRLVLRMGAGGTPPATGGPVSLTAAPDDVHLFDPVTGGRRS